PWEEAHDQPQCAEIIELHRPLEIVEAIERIHDASADRAAGFVNEIVAAAVLLRDAHDERIAGREIGDVGRIDPCFAARAIDLGLRLEELLFAARDEDYLGARFGEFQRGRLAYSR